MSRRNRQSLSNTCILSSGHHNTPSQTIPRCFTPVVPGLAEEVGRGFGEDLFLAAEEAQEECDDPIGQCVYSPLRDERYGHAGHPFALENANHGRIEKNRNVILKGLAGGGKTTLLRYYFAHYRPRLNDLPPHLMLWVDLKSRTQFGKKELYDAIHFRLEKSFGPGFEHEQVIWSEYIESKIGHS